MKIAVILLVFICSSLCLAQGVPCSSPEFNQFDFWVGNWQVSWKDSTGNTVRGMNTIGKDLNGCVIHEHFNDFMGRFQGESISVYDPKKKQWEQTWVDNKGNYMLFKGGMVGKVMDLRMERVNSKGQNELFSMIWTNVTADSLDWTWRKSVDGGKKWETLWKIHYTKQPTGAVVITPPSLGSTPSMVMPSQPAPPTQGAPEAPSSPVTPQVVPPNTPPPPQRPSGN